MRFDYFRRGQRSACLLLFLCLSSLSTLPDTADAGMSSGISREVRPLVNKAYLAMHDQRYAEAREYLQQALLVQKDSYDLTMLLAQVQEKEKNWVAVEKTLSKVVAARPGEAYPLASRGFARLNQGRVDEAEADFRQALKSNPSQEIRTNVEAVLAQIESRRQREQAENATPRPSEEVGRSAQLQALSDKAFQAYREGRLREAKECAEQVLANEPADYQLNMLMVNILQQERAWSEMEERLTKLLASRPNEAYLLASRGFARLNMGNSDKAEADFRQALERKPAPGVRENVEVALEQIKSQREAEKAQRAAREAETAMSTAAGPTLGEQAFQAYNEGRIKQARQLVEQALADEPSNYQLNMLLVSILQKQKDWSEVEKRLTLILAIKPDEPFVLASRGFARMNQRRYNVAATDFRQSLTLNPSPDLRSNIQTALGQIRRASSARKAPRVLPKPVPGVSAGETLLAAQKLIFEQKHNQAAERLRYLDVQKLSARERGLWCYLRAELLWHDNKNDQAFALYREAQPLLPETFYQAEIWWRMAEYERGRNQPEAAMQYAVKSAELLPDSNIRTFQAAYLFLHYKQDAEAAQYFETALGRMKTVPEEQAYIHMDLSYAYKRLGKNDAQQDQLERYVDLQENVVAKQSPKDRKSVESLYDARREHADLVRRFGWNIGSYYNSYENGDYAFQIINEFYWQPWYSNGRFVQVYGQLIGTMASRFRNSYIDEISGYSYRSESNYHFDDSALAVVGVRVDPLADHNLTLALENIFGLGRHTRDDFRGRIAYSWDTGLELEPYVPDWNYATFFNELVHSFSYNDTTYFGEARWGRSFRLDFLNDRLVVSPHVAAVWSYGGKDIDKGDRWTLEAGPGIHTRFWFREDKYNAPQSYTDLVLQYRFGLSHDRDNVIAVTWYWAF